MEVKGFTGYDISAVRLVGHKTQIKAFIDKKAMRIDKGIGGGEGINILFEISSAETRRLTNGQVKDVSR